MFNQLFQQPRIIKRYFEAPLFEDRMRYLTHRAKQGSLKATLCFIANYQLIIIKYLHLEKNRIITIEEIESAACRRALNKLPRCDRKDGFYFMNKDNFIRHATNWLRFLGRLDMPMQQAPLEQITEFINYLRKERNLCENTILNYNSNLRNFFCQSKEEPRKFLTHLTPAHLDEILIQKLQQGAYARNTIQHFASMLRTFFRYAQSRGWCRSGIADSIQSPRNYKHQALPSSPSWIDVQRLLKTTEGNSPSNIRDRAILLLLAVYGLRTSEVCKLKLEDFDWEQQVFCLKHSKHGPVQQLPLVQTVGLALIRYIKEVRSRSSNYREIFLTIHVPHHPIRSLYYIVHRRWEPLNVPIQHHGPHSLRHACATRLINQGVPLKTIADQLGHRDLETTRIYAKVDLSRLREVASFDMGGLS